MPAVVNGWWVMGVIGAFMWEMTYKLRLVLAYVSFVACMTLTYIWLRSYWMADHWSIDGGDRLIKDQVYSWNLNVYSSLGRLRAKYATSVEGVHVTRFSGLYLSSATYEHSVAVADPFPKVLDEFYGEGFEILGMRFYVSRGGSHYYSSQSDYPESPAEFPIWPFVLLTAVYPAWRFYKFDRNLNRQIRQAREFEMIMSRQAELPKAPH